MPRGRTRMATDGGGRTLREYPAGIQDRDAVAVFGFFHEVSRYHNCHSLFGERGNAPPKLTASQRIGTAGRLVEKKRLRFMQQCCRHRQALLETARQMIAWQICQRRQVKLPQSPGDPVAFVRAAQVIGAGKKFQIFAHRELPIE